MVIHPSHDLTGHAPQAPAKDHWLLVCTDGTCSQSYQGSYTDEQGIQQYNTSFVKKFYQDTAFGTGSGDRVYFDGPEVMGMEVTSIRDDAITWLAGKLQVYPQAKIVLVGHSRGAFISVLLANFLQSHEKEVVYMGLYDAVDRTPNVDGAKTSARNAAIVGGATTGVAGIGAGVIMGGAYGLTSSQGMDADEIPDNVKSVRHAVRDSYHGSRWWFGNTAMRWAGGTDFVRTFHATHGAIGGSMPHACNGQLFGYFVEDSCWYGRGISQDDNSRAGAEADAWIREGARAAGLPV